MARRRRGEELEIWGWIARFTRVCIVYSCVVCGLGAYRAFVLSALG